MLEDYLKDLPQEFIDAMKKPIIVREIYNNLNESEEDLKYVQLMCQNPEQNFIKISPQINLIVSPLLLESNEPYIINIKNDVNNYRKLYERQAKQINIIIDKTIESIKQIYPFSVNLQNNIKTYTENYSESIKNMQVPLLNKKKGLSEINYENYTPNKQDNFIKDRNNISKKIDVFFEDVDKFFLSFSEITKINCKKIQKAIEDFFKLPKSVKELSDLMNKSKQAFERSCKKFKDLSNKAAIEQAFKDFQKPLNELNEMEKQIQSIQTNSMKEYIEEQKVKIQETKEELDKIEQNLKNQSDLISKEITDIREKYGEEKKDLDDFTPAILSSVNIETGEFVEGILEKTQKINDEIKEINEKLNESMIILKEQSRLDLLFIMDITNSMDIYLDEVKEKFFSIIDTIRKECAGVEIFLGFIGYRDFSDLDFGEKYINLELTDELENILKNIKDINAEGGGDIPEDLCGALEFGKTKQWKGRSRFAILVTDSPCHGRKYYDETAENYDNYPDGDKLNRNIEDYVKYFAENEISVFCLRINQSTDKMFKIFKDVYDQNKPKDSNNQFIVDSGENIYKVVTTNAIKTFQNRKLLVVEESEAEENLNNQNSSK